MSETRYWLFGSFLSDPEGAGDIDLVLTGEEFAERDTLPLRELEGLARRHGCPVDLFLFPDADSGESLALHYAEATGWVFGVRKVLAADFFEPGRYATLSELRDWRAGS